MSSPPDYFIPAATVSTETEVKKSRFITTITPAASKEDVSHFFNTIRDQHPGANHNCFAYIIGNPKSPIDIGCSDDGEPSGTAGKPMLSVLQHNRIGDVTVMVSRFFGGTKLGTGGLVRAYSTAVKVTVEQVALDPFVNSCCVELTLPFHLESTIRHLLMKSDVAVTQAQYLENVLLEITAPTAILDTLQQQIRAVSKGDARFEIK